MRLEKERVRLLREQEKGAQILAELDVAKDVRSVLQNAYKRITTEELGRVSDLMNIIFLEMIGADPSRVRSFVRLRSVLNSISSSMVPRIERLILIET